MKQECFDNTRLINGQLTEIVVGRCEYKRSHDSQWHLDDILITSRAHTVQELGNRLKQIIQTYSLD